MRLRVIGLVVLITTSTLFGYEGLNQKEELSGARPYKNMFYSYAKKKWEALETMPDTIPNFVLTLYKPMFLGFGAARAFLPDERPLAGLCLITGGLCLLAHYSNEKARTVRTDDKPLQPLPLRAVFPEPTIKGMLRVNAYCAVAFSALSEYMK